MSPWTHNVDQPRGSMPWPWTMSIILGGVPEESVNILLLFIHLDLHLIIWLELYSRHYLQETMFIPTIFIEHSFNKTIVFENFDTLHTTLIVYT